MRLVGSNDDTASEARRTAFTWEAVLLGATAATEALVYLARSDDEREKALNAFQLLASMTKAARVQIARETTQAYLRDHQRHAADNPASAQPAAGHDVHDPRS